MSQTSPDSPIASPVTDPTGVAKKERLGRLGPLLFQAHFGWAITTSTVTGVLLPAVVQEIAGVPVTTGMPGPSSGGDTNEKVALYGELGIVFAVAGIIANIIFGALSDRTRTRWGRRNPWILGGGLIGAISLSAASLANQFWALVVCVTIFSIAFNAAIPALYAVFPDRVPLSRQGTASAIIGFVQVLTQALGGIIGAVFLTVSPRLGVAVLPLLFGLTCVVFVVFAKDTSESPARPPRLTIGTFFGVFRLPRDRDFLSLLGGRLLLNLAYNAVLFYQLYSLQDYLHLSKSEVAGTIAASGVITALGGSLGAAVAGPLSDRIKRRKPLFVFAAVLMGLALIPLIFSATVVALFTFMVFGSIAYGTYQSVDQAMMASVLPTLGDRARDLGILNIAHSLPLFIIPVVASIILVGLDLGYGGFYTACLVFAVLAAALITSIRDVR